MMERVRVRFPPSPTGYLHIGGARTALYNWLFAQKHQGCFVLRIEDTDLARSTEAAVGEIIEGLQWMGITWDEGPYLQSSYASEHRGVARRLLQQGRGYRCFCSRDVLEAKKEEAKRDHRSYRYDRSCRKINEEESMDRANRGEPHVIRVKVPDAGGSVSYEDVIFGREERSYGDMEDFVVLRSDGSPVYLLSNMVDDHRDRITHVIRGQDHRANTAKQVLLYDALGWRIPLFVHISLTLDPMKRKISKRVHGDVVTVRYYRERGFLPWALCNFIALLGWSPGGNREILSQQEMIEAFDLRRLSRVNSTFNYTPGDHRFFTDPKAISINAHYIHHMKLEELLPYVEEELKVEGLWDPAYEREQRDWFEKILNLIRIRYSTLKDFTTLGRAYFSDAYPIEEKAWRKNLCKDSRVGQWLLHIADRLESLECFNEQTTEDLIRASVDEWNIKAGLLINAIRAAVTGQTVGPGLFDILAFLGKNKVVNRLRQVARDMADHRACGHQVGGQPQDA